MRGEILKKYERFKKAIDFLEKLQEKDVEEIISDYTLLSSLERNIQVAVEFLVDLSNYILARTGYETPDTYKDIVSATGKLCGIDESLVGGIRGVIGLRNIIVHLYADVDYELVLEELGGIISSMLDYVSELFKCIKDLGIDP